MGRWVSGWVGGGACKGNEMRQRSSTNRSSDFSEELTRREAGRGRGAGLNPSGQTMDGMRRENHEIAKPIASVSPPPPPVPQIQQN